MIRKGRVVVSDVYRALVHRPVALTFAMLMVASTVAYPVELILQNQRYSLAPNVEELVGDVNPNLASKLKLNKNTGVYEFNGGVTEDNPLSPEPDPQAALASLKQQTGGGGKKSDNLYALDVPLDPKKGVSFYDKNLKLSFKTTPQFPLSSGQTDEDGRLIFPAPQGMKAVYSLKSNGLKEDMILTRPVGDSFSFSYKLDLPKELEARLLDDGSVGIYSADPVLFGNVTFGGDEDYEKLQSARETAVKDHLVFAIPAPVIIQQGNKSHSATSRFVLNDNVLTVESKGLEQLTYPISIDPSVVVTSSSDFKTGNNEGGITFGTDEIRRGSMTGAEMGDWTATTSFTTARDMHESVEYNGYVYVLGGYSGSTPLDDVQYAPINANGTLGTWQATSSFTLARSGFSSVAYNGYMYVIGGYAGVNGVQNDVQYAKINANGTLGTWQTTSSFTTARQAHSSVVNNGFVYIIGGASSPTTNHNDVQYAKINANGTLGTWQTTSSFTTARYDHSSVSYNGYVYIFGGAASGSLSSVLYARINTDGTLGGWNTTTSMLQPRNNHSTVVYNGYVYVIGGYGTAGNNSDVSYYAPLYSNGSVGNWTAAAKTFPTARFNQTSIVLNDYLYIIGGYNDVTRLSDVRFAQILPAGMNGSGTTTTPLPIIRSKGKDYGRYGHATVVYNGYIYVVGGYAEVAVANIEYAPLNANGTIGTWTATTSLPAARYYHASVVYNGYLYVVGGYTTAHSNQVLYAPLNTNGTVGTWTTNTATFTNARSSLGAVVHRDKLYVVGGYGTGFVEYSDVQYATINSSGSVGTFTASTSFATGRDSHYTAVMGKYLYVVGGWDGTTNFAGVQFAELSPSGGLVGGLSSCPSGGTLTNGTWCTTTNLQIARHAQTGYALKGCLYVVAGAISGNTLTATTEYACANSDGSLSTWQYGNRITSNTRNYASGAVNNDMMYLIGGESSGLPALSDVYYAPINNGGPGSVDAWSATSTMTSTRAGHTMTAYNGRLYAVGGFGSASLTTLNTVEFAPINADGTLGSWTSTTGFTTAREDHSAVVHNGYIYIMGGNNGSTYYNTVEFAPINADGTLGSWTSTSSFTTARATQGSVVANGYAYIVGGRGNSTYYSDVQYAAINTDGTLGSWTSTTSLPITLTGHAVVSHNGYMYALGGYSGSATVSSVYYAPINGNGTVGSWLLGSQFSVKRQHARAFVYNGSVYLLGGDPTTSSYYSDIQHAAIGDNGVLGEWSTTVPFTTGRGTMATAIYDGRVYLSGGTVSNVAQNDTQFTTIHSIPRTAAYSRLIDLGSVNTLNTITENGTGDRTVTFRAAGNDGVFGNTLGIGSANGVTARYVWVRVQMNDQAFAFYRDAQTQKSATTDITIDYTSGGAVSCTTDQRLRHGASFSSETLQALGTCIP